MNPSPSSTVVNYKLHCDICDCFVRERIILHRAFCKDCWNIDYNKQQEIKMERLFFPNLWKRRQIKMKN